MAYLKNISKMIATRLTEAADHRLTPEQRTTACWSLMELGAPVHAARYLRTIAPEKVSVQRQRLAAFAERMRAGRVYLPAARSFELDVCVMPAENARRTLVFCAGFGARFVVQDALLDLHECNIILVRSPGRGGFVSGIRGLANDYVGCCSAITSIAARLRGTELHFAGVSLGGYAAMRFGMDVSAASVMGFSSPTSLDWRDEVGANQFTYPHVKDALDQFPELCGNLRPLYLSPGRKPLTTIFFPASHVRDTLWAANLEAVSNVTLVPIAFGEGHDVFNELSARGRIVNTIERGMAGLPVMLGAGAYHRSA